MEKIELLAPAGSIESLYAAVNNKADAVYLGGSKFSARAYASNFDNEALEKAVDYAHSYGVKVYITINTLIKEKELKELINYVDFLYRIGVDALIVQDFGAYKAIKDLYENFEIHASTQMTIHNSEGALYLRDKGYHRIVLSREMTLKEIEYISKELGIETEIFIHGALCICYSGQCLMSSLIGGRSGNRGRCAQSCRLPYNLIRLEDGETKKGYLLSPKDISMIANLEDVINSGTSSLKIEGRMKRPEYVSGVIKSYREEIDNILNHKRKSPKDKEKMLLKLFNREGFSKAYFYKNEGKDMMAYNFPKNTGVLLGKAIKNGEIYLNEGVSLGDGIRVGEDGFTVSKILVDNISVERAEEGQKVKLLPQKYKNGDELYKTSDTKLLYELKESYRDPFGRKLPVKAEVSFKLNEPLRVTVHYEDYVITKEGSIIEKALKAPLSKEKIISNLCKSGDIPFKIEEVEFKDFEEGFLPVSLINEVRREVLETLRNEIVRSYKRVSKTRVKQEVEVDKVLKVEEEYIFVVSSLEQLKALKSRDVENIVVDIFRRGKNRITSKDIEKDYYLKVPNIIKEEYSYICKIIDDLLPNINGIVTSNLGIINRYRNKTKIVGDYKLNIFNSKSAEFIAEDVKVIPLSVELNRKEIIDTLNKSNANMQMQIYGKIEMMVSEYCPIGSTYGGKCSDKGCNNACLKSNYILEDRMKQKFPIVTDDFCRSHIYNSVALNLIDELEDLKKMGLRNFRIDLIDESYEETLSILDYIFKGKEFDSSKYTKGHYRRGVE